jgi:hypothetical protein
VDQVYAVSGSGTGARVNAVVLSRDAFVLDYYLSPATAIIAPI